MEAGRLSIANPAFGGASPTAQTPTPKKVGENIDVFSHAGEYASIPVLELLAAYGGVTSAVATLYTAPHMVA